MKFFHETFVSGVSPCKIEFSLCHCKQALSHFCPAAFQCVELLSKRTDISSRGKENLTVLTTFIKQAKKEDKGRFGDLREGGVSAGWSLQSDQGGAVGKQSPAATGRPDGADSLAYGRDRRANGQKARGQLFTDSGPSRHILSENSQGQSLFLE